MWIGLKMIDHISGAVESRLQLSENGAVGTEKIKKGNGKDKQQSCNKAYSQEDDLHVRDQLFVMRELVSLEQVEYQKYQRKNGIVDTVFEKRKLSCGEKGKMTAEQDKGGDVPAHDKHAYGHAHDGSADGIDIPQVFRSQEEGIGPEVFHERAVHYAEHDHPEEQEYLVFPEMKEKQLHG